MTADINNSTLLIAKCGLYCGACFKYKKKTCPGCTHYHDAKWCKVRSCCLENGHASCADCTKYSDPMSCKYFNNFMSKLFGLIFKSDRAACIASIKANGYEQFASFMSEKQWVTIKNLK